jgi:hypothetical protein
MNEQMKLEGRNADVIKSFETIDEIVKYLKANL